MRTKTFAWLTTDSDFYDNSKIAPMDTDHSEKSVAINDGNGCACANHNHHLWITNLNISRSTVICSEPLTSFHVIQSVNAAVRFNIQWFFIIYLNTCYLLLFNSVEIRNSRIPIKWWDHGISIESNWRRPSGALALCLWTCIVYEYVYSIHHLDIFIALISILSPFWYEKQKFAHFVRQRRWHKFNCLALSRATMKFSMHRHNINGQQTVDWCSNVLQNLSLRCKTDISRTHTGLNCEKNRKEDSERESEREKDDFQWHCVLVTFEHLTHFRFDS